ncbi:arrestin [Xylariaceae sp. FL0594]|nr:arrestin [Xylariaceae sp. FL0594]
MATKDTMKLHIDHHYRSKIYTTASTVSGHVEVMAPRGIDFDVMEILLLGTSRTSIDGVSIARATSHTFLKLIMPIPDSYYPIPRRFEAGSTYTIPFHFVIPKHLTLNACSHRVPSDALKEHHLLLPPAVGCWERDDCAPQMSRITYSVRARVLLGSPEGHLERLMEASCDIKVLPLVAEEPPLSLNKQDRIYAMSKTKTLRKSILSSRAGHVTISASQPSFVMASPDGCSVSPTTAHIDLKFAPMDTGLLPPRVAGVTAKVEVMTFYSSGGINQYPNLKDWSRSFGTDGRGVYTKTISLPSGTTPSSLEDLQWRQLLTEQARRDSGYCSDDTSRNNHDSSLGGKGAAPYYYLSSLRVLIQLPAAKKMYLPTFHSCITSRVYVLWLTVSLSAAVGGTRNLTLRVPLQVGVGNDSGRSRTVDATGLPTFEAAMEEPGTAGLQELDHPIQSRAMSMPDVYFQSDLPGYSEIGTRPRQTRQRR